MLKIRERMGQEGLTLIELLITIAVLAIVAAIAVPVVTNVVGSTNERAVTQTQSDIANFTEKYNKSGSYTYDPDTGTFAGYVDLDGNGSASDNEKIEELVVDTTKFSVTPSNDNAPSDTTGDFYGTTPNTTFAVEGASGGGEEVAEPARVVLTSNSPGWTVLDNGVTITCDSANFGESATFTIDGMETTITKRQTAGFGIRVYRFATACTSGITSMDNLLNRNETYNEDIGHWDTSSVTSMRGLFRGATAFNQDISNWDTSSVTTMYRMFRSADSFNQDLSSWDVSQVWDTVEFDLDANSWEENNKPIF